MMATMTTPANVSDQLMGLYGPEQLREVERCLLYTSASGAVLFYGNLRELHPTIQNNTFFACFFFHLFPKHFLRVRRQFAWS